MIDFAVGQNVKVKGTNSGQIGVDELDLCLKGWATYGIIILLAVVCRVDD